MQYNTAWIPHLRHRMHGHSTLPTLKRRHMHAEHCLCNPNRRISRQSTPPVIPSASPFSATGASESVAGGFFFPLPGGLPCFFFAVVFPAGTFFSVIVSPFFSLLDAAGLLS